MNDSSDDIKDFDDDLNDFDDDDNERTSSNKTFILIAVLMVALFIAGLFTIVVVVVISPNDHGKEPWINGQAVELPPNVTHWMPGSSSGTYYCERDGQWYQCHPKFP